MLQIFVLYQYVSRCLTVFYGEMPVRLKSHGEVSLRQNVITAKCPHGEIISRRNVLTAKFPYGEASVRQNVSRQNVLRQKVLRQKVREPSQTSAGWL